MALIRFDKVSLNYPLVGVRSHSLRAAIGNKVGGVLKKNPGGKSFVSALEQITFAVQEGDRYGIVGHNGAGKTTLLRLISGAYFPSSGVIERGAEIQALTDFTLGMDDNASGRENIRFRLAFMGRSKSEIDASIDSIIEFSSLNEFIDVPVRTYSSGMYLRLAFSISTQFMPEVLVMDEVVGVGDEGFRAKAVDRINNLIYKSKALILSSHDLSAIQKFCNKVLILNKGRVVFDGNVDDGVKYYRDGV